MSYEPIAGSIIFDALRDRDCIVLAGNVRVTKGVLRGFFRAAKDADAAVMVEMAKSECNQHTGYTGHTPKTYAKAAREAAAEVGHDIWALHADHITVKKGDEAELADTEELIAEQIDSGFTSFAIDASYQFDFDGGTHLEQLTPNIEVTTRLAKFIEEKTAGGAYGLEVEVGEIGKKDEHGMVLTSPEEAVVFISALKERGVRPHVLAVANGSTHGNVYDEHGYPIRQVAIDLERTKEIARALREAGHDVRIAQHGITGTPLDLIATKFPRGDIIKGNVGTQWQNIVWDVLSVFAPELYGDIRDWTLGKYMKEGKREEEIFGKSSKYAIKEFFERIYAVDESTERALEAAAYADALKFLRAFGAEGSAETVRRHMKSRSAG